MVHGYNCGADCNGDEHVTRVDDEVVFTEVLVTYRGNGDDCMADCGS